MAHHKVVGVEEEADMNSPMVAEGATSMEVVVGVTSMEVDAEAMSMEGVVVMNMEVAGVDMTIEVVMVATNKVVVVDAEAMIKEAAAVGEIKFKEAGQMVVAAVLVDIIKMAVTEILDFKLGATRVVEEGTKVVDIMEVVAVDTKVEVDTKEAVAEEDMEITKVLLVVILVGDTKVEATSKTTDFKMAAVQEEEVGEEAVVEEEDKVEVGVVVVHKPITKVVSLSSTFNTEDINIISLVLDKEGIIPVEITQASNKVELR